ncbi:PTS glucose transporter subunit IIA [Staphylococcus roterodami]|nr:PTS glucose transporter subunit IIA [Staphylococcus roterodami]
MSNTHIEQAQDILTAVGGVENVVNVSRDTKRMTIHMNHAIPSTANEVKQIAGVKAVEEHDEQFIIMFDENVEDIYKQLQLLIEKDKSRADSKNNNKKTQKTKQGRNAKVTTPILVKAPIAGRRILLKEVRDSIFREEMVGEGLAIKAHDMSKIISPFTGTVSMTVPTKHAIGIHSEEGVDLVIHIGVNTVKLNGEGFECLVKQDDYVNSGQPLLKFDRDYIEQQGYNSDVIVVISNSSDYAKVELTMNEIITTEDVIFKIFKN